MAYLDNTVKMICSPFVDSDLLITKLGMAGQRSRRY